MAPSKKDLCFTDLRDRILQLDLAPSIDLDEASFSEHYGLSRTLFREIFQTVVGEDYLSIKPNRGTVVAVIDLSTMRCCFQTAPIVYATIARLAAEQATPAEIKELKDAQKNSMPASAAFGNKAPALWSHQFHEIIGKMAANPYLLPSLRRLLIDRTRMSHIFYRAKTAEDSLQARKAAEQYDNMINTFKKHIQSLPWNLRWITGRLPETRSKSTSGLARFLKKFIQPFNGDTQ